MAETTTKPEAKTDTKPCPICGKAIVLPVVDFGGEGAVWYCGWKCASDAKERNSALPRR